VLRRRALSLAFAALPLGAAAQEQTPQQFLQSIYEPYKKTDFKGQPYWEFDRFFAPDLARAIDKDFAEAKKRKEVPTLDGDPFVDAQEWQVDSVVYAVTPIKDDKAARRGPGQSWSAQGIGADSGQDSGGLAHLRHRQRQRLAARALQAQVK
jgi:hypothetical protein